MTGGANHRDFIWMFFESPLGCTHIWRIHAAYACLSRLTDSIFEKLDCCLSNCMPVTESGMALRIVPMIDVLRNHSSDSRAIGFCMKPYAQPRVACCAWCGCCTRKGFICDDAWISIKKRAACLEHEAVKSHPGAKRILCRIQAGLRKVDLQVILCRAQIHQGESQAFDKIGIVRQGSAGRSLICWEESQSTPAFSGGRCTVCQPVSALHSLTELPL